MKKPWTLPMFAYGVNTNIRHLKKRCPSWGSTWCSAQLDDHRMRFEKAYPGAVNSYCNIREEPGSRVHGVLLWLDEDSFRRIDSYEGFPVHYGRKLVTVLSRKAGEQQAWAYFSDHVDPSLPPTPTYFRNVMEGLAASGAPRRYLDRLAEEVRAKTLADHNIL